MVNVCRQINSVFDSAVASLHSCGCGVFWRSCVVVVVWFWCGCDMFVVAKWLWCSYGVDVVQQCDSFTISPHTIGSYFKVTSPNFS